MSLLDHSDESEMLWWIYKIRSFFLFFFFLCLIFLFWYVLILTVVNDRTSTPVQSWGALATSSCTGWSCRQWRSKCEKSPGYRTVQTILDAVLSHWMQHIPSSLTLSVSEESSPGGGLCTLAWRLTKHCPSLSLYCPVQPLLSDLEHLEIISIFI